MDSVLIVGSGITGAVTASILRNKLPNTAKISIWDKGNGAGEFRSEMDRCSCAFLCLRIVGGFGNSVSTGPYMCPCPLKFTSGPLGVTFYWPILAT